MSADVFIVPESLDGGSFRLANDISKGLNVKSKIVKSVPVHKFPENSLVIYVGKNAYKENTDPSVRSIISFVSSYDFDEMKNLSIKGQLNNVIPSFSGAAPEDILSFVKDTFKTATIGYIYSEKPDFYLNRLKERLTQYKGLSIEAVSKGDVYKSLNKLINTKRIDVMLITNNSKVFDRRNIQYILESLYRKKIPAIGVSKGLVGKGVLASIYQNKSQIVSRTIDAAEKILKRRTPSISYGKSSVKYDESLARIYNIEVK